MAEAELIRKSDGSYERKSPFAEKDPKGFWTDAPIDKAHKNIWDYVQSLRSKQTWRQQCDDLALQLYSDMRYVGYRGNGSNYGKRDVIDSRIGTNVIRAIVRTLNSKIARRRSRPYIVTDGASFMQRQTAENLEKWLLGKLRTLRADEDIFPLWRLHALTFGTGCLRVFSDAENGVQLEVIPPTEIFVDDSEARYGTPRSIYFVRVTSKSRLYKLYPDKKEALDRIRDQVPDTRFRISSAWDSPRDSDVCTIIEAIHLPSLKGAKDGRHVICVDGGTLLDEVWERDHFNCAWMRGELRPAGFWGIGVPEDLAATQLEISGTANARNEIIDLLANPYWLVERGMKVLRSAFSDLVGRVMEFTSTGSGGKPELVAPRAVPQELWQHEDYLKRSAFETRGVSQLSAQMLKPQGLNSGKALRAYTELESELLADLMNDYESGLLQTCSLMIEEQIALSKRYPKKEFKTTYLGSGEIEQIDWKDVGLQNDLRGYIIEILPASALASTLSARIEDVFDLKDLGVLHDPEEVWDYIDMPDRRRLKKKKLSPRKLLERVIEMRIVRDGEDVQPEPTWNLALAAQLTLANIAELELYEDMPKDRLELLRKFLGRIEFMIRDAENKLKAKAAEEAAMAASGGAMPPPEGMPLDPSSDPNLAGLDPNASLPPAAPDLGGGATAAEAAAAGSVAG